MRLTVLSYVFVGLSLSVLSIQSIHASDDDDGKWGLSDSVVQERWDDFKNRFKKNYAPDEENNRYEIFKRNLAEIEKLNSKNRAVNGQMPFGVDEFTDLDLSEVPYVDGATHINGSKPPTPSPKPSPKPSPTPPPAECIHADPTVTISPVAQWGYRGGLLTYQVQVKNNDSAGCENTQLAFALRTPSQAYGGFSSSFIVSAPGETSLNLVQLRIRKKAPRRTYSFAVTAYNAYMPQVQGSALGMFVVN